MRRYIIKKVEQLSQKSVRASRLFLDKTPEQAKTHVNKNLQVFRIELVVVARELLITNTEKMLEQRVDELNNVQHVCDHFRVSMKKVQIKGHGGRRVRGAYKPIQVALHQIKAVEFLVPVDRRRSQYRILATHSRLFCLIQIANETLGARMHYTVVKKLSIFD